MGVPSLALVKDRHPTVRIVAYPVYHWGASKPENRSILPANHLFNQRL